jgi:hypothetical protein
LYAWKHAVASGHASRELGSCPENVLLLMTLPRDLFPDDIATAVFGLSLAQLRPAIEAAALDARSPVCES